MNTTTQKLAGAGLLALSVSGLGLLGATGANAAVPGPNADAFAGPQDTVLAVDSANGVLANDWCDGGVATVGGIQNFFTAELNMHVDGSFEYTPPAGYIGERKFDYELLCDGNSSGFATASIIFSPTVPAGAADFYTTPQDTVLTVPANGVLANDNGALAAVDAKDLPEGLIPQFDGSFVYAPPAGFVGDVSWSYRMSNGSDTFSDWIPVTITVTPVTPATPVTPVTPDPQVAPDVPADDVDPGADLPTLAYTGAGDVSTWLLGPALALLGLGAAGTYIARRRAQLS
jgi:hypothetical protein